MTPVYNQGSCVILTIFPVNIAAPEFYSALKQ